MPFTVSHAVVALPAVRGPLPAAAVAAGAMAPDVPLFLGGGLSYADTHAFPSLLVTALPAGAVLLVVWSVLLRPAAGILLPSVVASRVPASWSHRSRPTVRGALLALVALLLGVLTHVAWDAFTHAGRLGTELLPALAEPWGPLPGYRWIQYASSVGGLIVLLVAGILGLRHAEPRPVPRRHGGRVLRISLAAAVVAIAAAVVLVPVAADGVPRDVGALRDLVYDAITRGGAAVALAVLLAALIATGIRGAAPSRPPA
ncbi:DUF4184 family protein [Clavibacter californiensis]|uniref:DUF4184 family protein n=1 Tax=Clavibacter californiensis TaxID=1401995 RepID=A0ABX9N3Y4_9MICO|nr:DUF4184 family protein [Clavibacter californiensis]RII89984.1 DUF4184 family protein [Clavibacter californiensis]UKF78801.1 DUF4184 family protein [Clavibacter californiensis]